MENIEEIMHDEQEKQQCEKCKELATEIEEYQILLLAATFIGPIIGMLIGLFAGKKLLKKET